MTATVQRSLATSMAELKGQMVKEHEDLQKRLYEENYERVRNAVLAAYQSHQRRVDVTLDPIGGHHQEKVKTRNMLAGLAERLATDLRAPDLHVEAVSKNIGCEPRHVLEIKIGDEWYHDQPEQDDDNGDA